MFNILKRGLLLPEQIYNYTYGVFPPVIPGSVEKAPEAATALPLIR